MYNKFEFPVIETERLILRDLTLGEEDVRSVLKHFSDTEVTRFMDIEPVKDYDEAKEIIRFHVEDSGCRWGLRKKDGNVFVGTCGFHRWDKDRRIAEIGYDLSKQFWGQCLMYETLQAVLKFGFEKMDLSRIETTIEVDNHRSVNLVKRMGFDREDELRDGLICFFLTKEHFA